MSNRNRLFLAVASYVATIVAANVMTSTLGFWPVGFGLTASAGTYAAGLSFLARDLVQEAGGRAAVLAAVAVGAALSWWMSSPALAAASGAAFLVSELADFAVYTPMRDRGWSRPSAMLASNVAGALVDTYLFLWLATPVLAGFNPAFTIASAAPGQIVGKLLWATLVPVTVVAAVGRVRSPRPAAS